MKLPTVEEFRLALAAYTEESPHGVAAAIDQSPEMSRLWWSLTQDLRAVSAPWMDTAEFVDRAKALVVAGLNIGIRIGEARNLKFSNAERILASRLLDSAASKFHEHGCNDMDPEYFEDLEPEEIQQLVAGYNAWNRGETGEACGNEEYTKMANIGDDMWMAYLAAVIGRK